MTGRQFVDRFEFNQQQAIYDKIGPEPEPQITALVKRLNFHLPLEDNALISQLKGNSVLINGFEQSRPKLSVNHKCGIEYRGDKRIRTILHRLFAVFAVFAVVNQGDQSSNWLLMHIASAIVVRPLTTRRTASRRRVSPAICLRAARTKLPTSASLIASTMSLLISSIS